MADAQESPKLDRTLGLEIVRVTEATAIGAARLRGRGNEAAADSAAINAMYRELARLPIQGVIVVGEGEESEAPLLYIGETVGAGSSSGLDVDIAVDPVEGSTLAAKALPNALAVMAIAERGSLLKVPTLYMDKIAIGPGYAKDLIDLDAPPADNLNALAKAKGVPVTEITVCILDRPRHGKLIANVGDHRGRQARGRAEELAQRRDEVPAGQAVQVQQRQHLGDLRGLPRPRWQDR